ncbi:hypothetical protein RGF97_33090 [Streptomyces roseicoloratus]|uniref:Gram-positive cocci surface proteins LPxTG domain-containing protein n=1 Tax=Streptomyces roseicoloratus TaxID=2508722 RepID=A0ABY9S2L1_9ACTN|nr:hypothetical protein [Streptomyces roseicoloratus]WMX48669.1 hypothetical protein RGF97_33090 [Streptomyces roseicoloratus]
MTSPCPSNCSSASPTRPPEGRRTDPEPRTGADAEGGFSFNSATPIGPGTHRQSIAVGEAPFWRVEVKAGQKLTVKGGVDIPADFPHSAPTGWTVTVYNAQRNATLCNDDHDSTELFAGKTGHFERVCGPWDITAPDDSKSDPDGYDVPGTYYIQAQVAEPDDKAKGIVVPISLTVDISGTARPDNGPVFFFGDAAAQGPARPGTNENGETGENGSTSAPAPSAKDGDSLLSTLAVPAGIAAAVLVIGGITLVALRRRKSA